MGTDVDSKVVGIDIIWIKMYNDIVMTLTDVKHVPELKKKLMYLGMLESNECTYKVGSTVLMIAHSAIVVKKKSL